MKTTDIMEKQLETTTNRFRRIVVKVGSNVLTRKDGTLDVTHMSALVDQLAELHRRGVEVILVSSGAVASGRGEVHPAQTLDDVSQRQLYSAVGQAKLMNRYYDLFRNYGIVVGQVLTTKESIATPRHYSNQRNCVEVMLQLGVMPIVNENDTVSITELMFTDNDELSGLMATMMHADALFLLSNVDGVYDGAPSSPSSRLIRQVEVGKDLSDYIQPEKSGFGRGGMASKSSIAHKAADEGIAVFIANGRREGIILSLFQQPESAPCTQFIPRKNPQNE
jgi:glutamate 5-kinase